MKKIYSIMSVFFLLFFLMSCGKEEKTSVKKYVPKVSSLLVYGVYDEEDVFSDAIKSFENKYNINIKYKKFENIENYQEQLIDEMASGKGPDVFMIHNTWISKYRNKLVPAHPKITLSPKFFENEYISAVVANCMGNSTATSIDKKGNLVKKTENVVLCVPLGISPLGLYFNKKHFENNIQAITGRSEPAETWNEFAEDMQYLNRRQGGDCGFAVSGFASGSGNSLRRGSDIFLSMVSQKQNKINAPQRPKFDDKLTKEAMDFFYQFGDENSDYYSWDKDCVSQDSVTKELDLFLKGKVSIIAGYPYLYEKLKTQIKLNNASIDINDIGIAPMPQFDNPNKTSGNASVYANFFGFVVSKHSKDKELSWRFINTVSNDENMKKYFDKTKLPSTKIKLLKQESSDPIYGIFVKQAPISRTFYLKNGDYGGFRKKINDVIDAIVHENKKIESMLSWLDKNI